VPDAPLPDNRPGKQPYDEVLDDLAARVAILKGRI
jgi:hypothetical protein